MKIVSLFILIAFFPFMGFAKAPSLSSAPSDSKELKKALEYLGEYKKTRDGGYRRLFQDYLSDAASKGEPKAQYLYYSINKYKEYEGEDYPDVRLSDSLGYVYLQNAAKADFLLAVREMGHIYSKGVYDGTIDIKKNRKLGFNYLNRAETLNTPDIHLALVYHYVGQADTVPGSLQEAKRSVEKLERIGDKKYKWRALGAKANIAFLEGDYKLASDLYKKWLEKNVKELGIAFQSKWNKADENFVGPDYDDLAMAAGSFIESGDIQSLALVTTGRDAVLNPINYDEPRKKVDLSIWNPDTDQGQVNLNALSIVNDYFVRRNKFNGEHLKKLSFIPKLYSYSDNFPLGFFLDISSYYKKIGDREKEKEMLRKGSEKGSRNCSVVLASHYYSGSDGYPKDYDSCYKFLEKVESDFLSNEFELDGSMAAKAAYMLAKIYYTSEFSGHDYKKAVKYANLFKQIKGHSNQRGALGDIYRLLSNCYRFGRGVEVDEQLADEYLHLASEEGDFDAKEMEDWLYGEKKMEDSSNNP